MFLAAMALASALSASALPPAVRATGNLEEFVLGDDYPSEALRNEEEGTVGFRLSVGPDGRVTDCAVTSTSHSASLDEITCEIMRERARLQPARGTDGYAVEDVMDAQLAWRIDSDDVVSGRTAATSDATWLSAKPAHRARSVEPLSGYISAWDAPIGQWNARTRGVTEFHLYIDPAGKVRGCEVTTSSGSPPLDRVTCQMMLDRARFVPARDAEGSAVADEHWGHVHWGGATHFDTRVAASTNPPSGPPASLASYISNDDYPAEALRNHEEGIVGFRLHIGPDGLPHGCVITSSSGFPSLDSKTCELLVSRARYTPARNNLGQPTDDYDEGRMTWRITD